MGGIPFQLGAARGLICSGSGFVSPSVSFGLAGLLARVLRRLRKREHLPLRCGIVGVTHDLASAVRQDFDDKTVADDRLCHLSPSRSSLAEIRHTARANALNVQVIGFRDDLHLWPEVPPERV